MAPHKRDENNQKKRNKGEEKTGKKMRPIERKTYIIHIFPNHIDHLRPTLSGRMKAGMVPQSEPLQT